MDFREKEREVREIARRLLQTSSEPMKRWMNRITSFSVELGRRRLAQTGFSVFIK